MKILDTPRSGSVAGVTASHNRFGQYYRTRAIPVQPRTPKQTRNRASLSIGSSGWRGLTDALRNGWNDYAAQITRSGSLGSSYSPTGAMLFSAATILNGGSITDPPAELPNYVLSIAGMSYTDPTPGPEALSLNINETSTDNVIIVETSGPVSPGVTSAAAVRRWRSLPGGTNNLQPRQFAMSATTVDILSPYKSLFPSPLPGQVIWFRAREIFFASNFTPVTNNNPQTYRLVIV